MWYIIIFVATLLLDQISKILIDVAAEEYEVLLEIIPKFLRIELNYNDGAAFNMLGDKAWAQVFFIVLTVVVLIAGVVFVCIKKPRSKWLNTTIALMFSGTIGNFIDRISFQKVRDFINFPWFANCNIADFCLCIGAGMLIIYILFIDGDALFKGKGDRQKATEKANEKVTENANEKVTEKVTENLTKKSSSDGENATPVTGDNGISKTENISDGENAFDLGERLNHSKDLDSETLCKELEVKE